MLPTPTSYPSIPAQPMLAEYGIANLYTVRVFNGGRDEYATEYGQAAPPFNTAWPVKLWFDSTFATLPPATPVSYLVQVGGVVTVLITTAGEACAPNLLPDGPITDPAILAASLLPQVPVPIRALITGPSAETLVFDGPTGAVAVQRADLQNQANVAAGQFLPADRTTLNTLATAAQVSALAAQVASIAAIVTQIQQHQN